MIDATQSGGPVTEVSAGLGGATIGIGFDGNKIWTANNGSSITSASVSIVTPAATTPWPVPLSPSASKVLSEFFTMVAISGSRIAPPSPS
jgi:hypothetical protein